MTAAVPLGRRVRAPWRTALKSAAWLLPAILLGGCSAGTSHRVLSFFFDGVPEPAGATRDGGAGARQEPTAPAGSYSRHAPYAKKLCAECHEKATNKLVAPVPELCFRCHKFELSKRRYVHAPVVSGFCRLCHDPHSSRNPFLLIIKPEELCFYCHNPEDVFRNAAHPDHDTPCLQCHNPHADNRFFLRADRLAEPAPPAEARPGP